MGFGAGAMAGFRLDTRVARYFPTLMPKYNDPREYHVH